jgi:hypothetical protein
MRAGLVERRQQQDNNINRFSVNTVKVNRLGGNSQSHYQLPYRSAFAVRNRYAGAYTSASDLLTTEDRLQGTFLSSSNLPASSRSASSVIIERLSLPQGTHATRL